MTNAIGDNQIVYWQRATTGQLTLVASYHTLGGGSGTQLDATDSLGSQGGIVLDAGHNHLFAVNTETLAVNSQDCQQGSISSFSVANDGTLTFIEKVESGGLFPSSLTMRGNELFVLNAGGPGACGVLPNVTGFRISPFGRLSPNGLGSSMQTIDPGPTYGGLTGENCSGHGPFATVAFNCGRNPPAFPRSPAQVAFVPGMEALIVTVKGTNSIYFFPLGENGKPKTPAVIRQATGPFIPTWFGFGFDGGGHLIVSEPFGAALTIPTAPASAVSSFSISADGVLTPITLDSANGRGTSCWIAISGNYAYAGNNNTSDISSYIIAADGSLTLLAGTAAATGLHPNDLAIARDVGNSFLYALNAGDGTVGAWRINANGSLTSLGTTAGLPADAGAQGLVAY
jgi:hypothetical protein